MVDFAKQLKVPPLDPNFFVLDEDRINIDRLEKLSEKHPINILVTGNQGCGKSSLVRQFASYYQRPMATFQVGLLSEAGQLFGQQRLKEGETPETLAGEFTCGLHLSICRKATLWRLMLM